MPESSLLTMGHAVREIEQADPLEFALFLGAGASRSSGVVTATEMIEEWRRRAHHESANEADLQTWLEGQPFYGKENEYSLLFEHVFVNPRARQRCIEEKIKDAFPSWGYLYLANIIRSGRFNLVFTTNFDDLISQALSKYLGVSPVVCGVDSEVAMINITTKRPKIIKLHGDFLFKDIKNTPEELEKLGRNMRSKFEEFARQCGMIVVGYSGYDRSVMRVIEKLLKKPSTFPAGIYWGVRSDGRVSDWVQRLVGQHEKRFHLFSCDDFDIFMARLHDALKLTLPQTILQPYAELQRNFSRLIQKPTEYQKKDQSIQQHIRQLETELGRSWAKAADTSLFDLLEAQTALGRRDYAEAIAYAARYVEQQRDHPEDLANGLTVWGSALAIKSEEEGSEADMEAAAAKWQEAIAAHSEALQALYGLVRYYVRKQKYAEGIDLCERLLKKAPNDRLLRRNLATLYGGVGEVEKAEQQIDWLLQREPEMAEHHALKASILEQRGFMEESLAALKTASSKDSQNALWHIYLADRLAKVGRFEQAGVEYQEAVRLDPDNLNYRLQIGGFYSRLMQPMMALPHLEQAVKLNPKSPEARGVLGELYMMLQRPAEAEAEMLAALGSSPKDPRIVGNLGIIYLYLNRTDQAEHYLRLSTQLNPSAPQPYMFLCQLYWVQRRIPEFQAAMQRLAQIAPVMAQQLQMQLQAMANPMQAQAAMQSQWMAYLQSQAQAPPPQQAWSPFVQKPGAPQQPTIGSLLKSLLSKFPGST
jgi:tetratricopeptide (TPR) repeat protein